MSSLALRRHGSALAIGLALALVCLLGTPLFRALSEPSARLPLALTLFAGALIGLLARARRAPADSESGIRQNVERMAGYAWAATRDGAVEHVNPRLLGFTGLGLEDALGGGWIQIIHPDDLDRTLAAWTHSVRTGETYELERRMRAADGSYRWFHTTAEPVRDRRGNVVRWFGIDIDIDDRMRAQVALDESERELRASLEGLPGYIAAADSAGNQDYVNRRMLEFLGVEQTDLTDLGWAEVVHPEDREAVVSGWLRSTGSGVPWDATCRMRRADGVYRWFHTRAEPRFGEDGRVLRWYGLFVEIDEERKAEDALRAMQGELARASRIATVAELSASIAHEINQPLAAVVANGYACQRWMSADPPDLAMARESAARIVRDGHAAAEVVQRIRSLFRQGPVATAPLDLNAVIAEVCRLLLDEVRGKAIRIETQLAPALPRTLADRVQMQQVLLNLLHNAVDAMEAANGQAKSLVIRSLARADEVVVEVSDQGVGLENAERVFEPFFTTKGGGMGMGLAICRSIVEAHDGRLWTAPNEPHGTTFSFALRAVTGGRQN